MGFHAVNVKRNRFRGYSLIEVMMAIMLFMVTMISFSMIFPTGYHLNLKSFRENQSVELANAILQEIASKPFYSPPGGGNLGDTLYQLSNLSSLSQGGWDSECSRQDGLPVCGCVTPTSWTPESICLFYQNNPLLAKKFRYLLRSAGTKTPPGIEVRFLSGGNSNLLDDNPIVRVTVRLSWSEATEDARPVPHMMALTTFATYNR